MSCLYVFKDIDVDYLPHLCGNPKDLVQMKTKDKKMSIKKSSKYDNAFNYLCLW